MITDNGNSNGQAPSKSDPRLGSRAATASPNPGRPTPTTPPAGGVNASAVLHGIRRWWKIALPVGVIVSAVGGVAGWVLMVPQYTADAYVQVSSDNDRLVFETADNVSKGATAFTMFQNTQQQMMVNPLVLTAALRDPAVADLPEILSQPDPIAWLQESLKVSYPAKSEIMKISLESPSGESCVKIVNAVVNAYMSEVVEEARKERLKRRDNLELAHGLAEDKVRSKRTEFKGLASALGTGDSDSLTVAQQSALTQYGFMQEKLSTIQFQLLQAEGELSIAQEVMQKQAALQAEVAEGAAGSEPSVVPSNEFDLSLLERPAQLVRLEDEILGMKVRMSANSSSLGNGHPSVRRMATEVKMKEEQYQRNMLDFERQARARYEQGLPMLQANTGQPNRGAAAGNLPPRFDVIQMAARIDALKFQEKILLDKVEQLSNETRQLGKSSIDLELMRSEIAGLDEVLRRVSEEIERTSIELNTSSRVKLLSPAKNATPPDPKKRIALTAFLALTGLVLPLGAAVAWDLSRSKVSDASGINSALALPTLGTIPFVFSDPLNTATKEKMARHTVREKINLKESIDAVAAMILHRAHEEDRQVFMVTSAVSGEGKSTTVCQLASSVARAGKRVLLVDMDLRRPSVHRYLKVNRFPGVAELLHDEEELGDVIQASAIRNLDVIAAGRRECQVQEREMTGALEHVIANLREHYDLILIDACPVLPIVDARIIGKHTDGVILTLLRDVSRLPLAAQACQMLKSYGVSVLGAVVIGAHASGYSPYYYSEDRHADDTPVHTKDSPRLASKPTSRSGKG